MRRVTIFASLALLLTATVVLGQAQRGTITVKVTDSEGAMVPGATVEVSSANTLTRRTAFTDERGEARLVGLDPATNYVVTANLEGFAESAVEAVVVRAGIDTTVTASLQVAGIAEELVVTSEAPLVDTTSQLAGQNITLDLTESLPTTRGYQGYLQLVPGVQDAFSQNLTNAGNPASRSGLNYRDRDKRGEDVGDAGVSTDNLYYFDGINVTDRTLGFAGADLNTEIIQEQSVITGAIPAEYVGVPGLVSNVITKSGGNAFSGSVNYYFQNDSLVADNEHFPDDTFDTYDAAFTLGGPIVRDRAWFFASLRVIEFDRDVVDEQGTFLRPVQRDQDQGFGKLTWAVTDSDLVTGMYLSDPTDDDGNFRRVVPNDADSIFERGGERWSGSYNRVWSAASLELGYTQHDADTFEFPKNDSPQNEVSFASGVDFTSAEGTLGGAGLDALDTRSTEGGRISLEYLFDTSWGSHALKGGYSSADSDLEEIRDTKGSPPATYISLNPRGTSGTVRLCEITGACGAQWSTADFGLSTDETRGLRENLSAGQLATLVGLWDGNGNGILDDAEIINNMTFSTTAGNPNGLINYTRDEQTQAGVSKKGSESDQYFIQDGWQWNRWSVNAGLRAEDTTFLTDTGADIGTWDTEIAPRVSISYDLGGTGRRSIGGFYGEYYDAYRDNAIDFAGSLQGNVFEEQVFVDALGEWVNFRDRGGVATRDAFFAPIIGTPVTEEYQIQYKQDLGRNMMFEINLIDRETKDIAEDYGRVYYALDQFTDPSVGGDPNAPGTLFLGPGYFGFTSLEEIDALNLNFLIGSLPPGAFRDWQGLELIFRKRYSNNWQMIASYNYADADANTNSDSNFDGAGDVFPLDPRAPNRTGTQPGLVEHLFKVHGSYSFDMGLQVGGSYRWNSGINLNRNGQQAFDRSIPALTDTGFPSNGLPGTGGLFGSTWIASDAIGYFDGMDYGVFDARVSYLWEINDRFRADFFVDIFNVFDDQKVIQIQDIQATIDGFAFEEGINFVEPRRFFLGARLRF